MAKRRRRREPPRANRRLPTSSRSDVFNASRRAFNGFTQWNPSRPVFEFKRTRFATSRNLLRPSFQPVYTPAGKFPKLYSSLPAVEPALKGRTLTCVRRKVREEVLHALRKTGKRGQKSPRWNLQSKIKCK